MTQQDLDEVKEMCATGAYYLVSRLLKEREMLATAIKSHMCGDCGERPSEAPNSVECRCCAGLFEAIKYAEEDSGLRPTGSVPARCACGRIMLADLAGEAVDGGRTVHCFSSCFIPARPVIAGSPSGEKL